MHLAAREVALDAVLVASGVGTASVLASSLVEVAVLLSVI